MAGTWGIGEWYGQDIETMSSAERKRAADHALAAREVGIEDAPQPLCPFLSEVRPGSRCNKVGGVCSMRLYENDPVVVVDEQPATVCPNRFLGAGKEGSVFALIAKELFGVEEGAKVVKEVPFLMKLNADGEARAAKAGRIDWIVVPRPPESDSSALDWVAVETQAVYFSGSKFEGDFEMYRDDPAQLHFPNAPKGRRPDYRSSGAKRLAPQLDAKSPVMRRWGVKVAVVIDRSFADDLGVMDVTSDDFDNAEVVFFIMRYDKNFEMQLDEVRMTELESAIRALQATAPISKAEFEKLLRRELERNSAKVHDA